MARIAIYKDYPTRSLGKSTAVIEFRTSSKSFHKVFDVVVVVVMFAVVTPVVIDVVFVASLNQMKQDGKTGFQKDFKRFNMNIDWPISIFCVYHKQ